MLLNYLLLEILTYDQKCIWKIILPLFISLTPFPLPSSLHLPLHPTPCPHFPPLYPLILVSAFYWQGLLSDTTLSLSASSPGFYKCFMLSFFGRACCYKESFSDSRVSVKHKVYFLMKNCIQTTREHYFLNLILIWHVLKITWSSSWRKQRRFTFLNSFIPLRLSSAQCFKLGIKLKCTIYRMRFLLRLSSAQCFKLGIKLKCTIYRMRFLLIDMELVTEYNVKRTQLFVCFCRYNRFKKSSRNEMMITCKTSHL